MEFVVTSANV